MKYLIANLVTEFEPKYELLKKLSEPFIYNGERVTDIFLHISDDRIDNLLKRMTPQTHRAQAEEFAYASAFNKAIIKHDAMLVHSSAIKYKGKAYLFSASSGIGKSTHTKLWQKAFGEEVNIINDDKPVVRIKNGVCKVYGTPFDGGSGIAINDSAPLQAIVFLERGESNSIRKATINEIIKNLYFSTTHFVSKETAESMLHNFDKLTNYAEFYILTCNMDIEAAYLAYDAIVK